MDYIRSYKLKNKSTHFHEGENLQKLKDCQILNVIKDLGHWNNDVYWVQIEKKTIF